MRAIDLKSVMIAGAIGATLMIAWGFLMAEPPAGLPSVSSAAGVGFTIGAGVQVGVRLLGVS